ncbi:MAG TPA: U32 family peptidase [Tissierellaceae bacterium]
MKKVELLAPAGDMEKLKMAIRYGADAVYLGGEAFGLRTASKNFSMEDIEEAVKYAHDRDKRIYVTLNIVPHNEDLDGIEDFVLDLYYAGVDAVIVSDPGMFSIIKRSAPNLPIHISTQASVTNYETINFWYDLGVRRVVLARELSLDEIRELRKNIPEDMELEAFVHGAMCMSYSGRCLISNYMTGRDANRGDCSHACRYKYHLMEETRPGQYFPVFEDEQGTFIMNSKDLCMIKYLDQLVEAGINSFKIEGRVKSLYYVSTIIGAYRLGIDDVYKDVDLFNKNKDFYYEEVRKVSHREFTTGFYFGKPNDAQVYDTSSYIREYDFLGMVVDFDKETNIATVEQRNRTFKGDEIEIFGPHTKYFTQIIEKMWDENDNEIDVAPHAQQIFKIKVDQPIDKYYLIRKERKEK